MNTFVQWYRTALAECEGGLITQAQAARILGVSRMKVNRLICNRFIRSYWYPSISLQDVMHGSASRKRACYVSLDDTCALLKETTNDS